MKGNIIPSSRLGGSIHKYGYVFGENDGIVRPLVVAAHGGRADRVHRTEGGAVSSTVRAVHPDGRDPVRVLLEQPGRLRRDVVVPLPEDVRVGAGRLRPRH